MTIIKKRKRLVVDDKVKVYELDQSTNPETQHSLRRENERLRLLSLKVPIFIDEDLIL